MQIILNCTISYGGASSAFSIYKSFATDTHIGINLRPYIYPAYSFSYLNISSNIRFST